MARSRQLDHYARYVGEETLAQIYQAASELSDAHVMHFNTTAEGGGVAEILNKLLPIMDELGIRHTWRVIPLDETSSHFTALLMDMLQGNEPGEVPLADKNVFLDKLRRSLGGVEGNEADIYFVHDFQLAPLAEFFPWMRPALWFCHIDTADPNLSAKQYLLDYLDPYRLCCFNGRPSVFPELPLERTQVVTLGIDPFRDKNRTVTLPHGLKLLAKCGIDTERPLITQVSRFGRWKNPWQVIDVYRLVKKEIPSVQVALVGALEAADDIDAFTILDELKQYAGDDPDVHLLSDPHLITHVEVNAFQHYSSVILQRSTREGFGLTVTEAMWKYQPIVGTSATGMRTQLIDGYNGYIVDDTEACAARTLQLLQDRHLWHRLGRHAHEHVRTHFLFPYMIRDYLEALSRASKKTKELSSAAGGE